uniref:Zinc/manganese transport system substrate-binding protein n=1 Tax=Steinernema glaseri TaxID=37863 RepID=A0A1I7YIX0_9BILA
MDGRRLNSESHEEPPHEEHQHHVVEDIAHDHHAFVPFPGHIPPGATASAFVRINAHDPHAMRARLKQNKKNVSLDK